MHNINFEPGVIPPEPPLALRFAEVVRPRWTDPDDRAAYPTAVVSGEIIATTGGDTRAQVILIPAAGDPPKEWRVYASAVDLTQTSLLDEAVAALKQQVQRGYARRSAW